MQAAAALGGFSYAGPKLYAKDMVPIPVVNFWMLVGNEVGTGQATVCNRPEALRRRTPPERCTSI